MYIHLFVQEYEDGYRVLAAYNSASKAEFARKQIAETIPGQYGIRRFKIERENYIKCDECGEFCNQTFPSTKDGNEREICQHCYESDHYVC